jgi:hypothetical protein
LFSGNCKKKRRSHSERGTFEIQDSLYVQVCGSFDIVPKVPLHTEARIQQLCKEAIAAQSEADVNRILQELREALQEHVRLAKASLQAQANAVSVLENVASRLVRSPS